VAFLLFQLLFIYLLSALMLMRVESEFKQIATFPQSSQKQYAAFHGIGRAEITATYLIDLSGREFYSRYTQQLQQHGWYSGDEIGIIHCCGVSWWYEKEGLVAIVDFRYKDRGAEVNARIVWGLSPWDNATRIAAGLDVLIVFALLATWRARAKCI
jgi:hypothetical protein